MISREASIKIGTATKGQLFEIKKLYRSAFPRNERKPFWLIKRTVSKGMADILAIEAGGRLAGFFVVLKHRDLALVDYFAIHPDIRGGGIGSTALGQLCKLYRGKRLFLEIEAPLANTPNYEQRIRRKNFYHRNGFTDTGIAMAVYGTDMELLAYQCVITFEEYVDVLRSIFGRWVKGLLHIQKKVV